MKYDFDFHRGKKNIKKLINTSYVNSDEIKKALKTKMSYKNHKDIFRLFKNIFIKKNLLTKDYDDLKKTFLKFIPEDFVNEVGEAGIDKISLGVSVKKYFTVLFLDIIGFTSITEKITQEKALLLLNIYFDGIVDIVNYYGGYIDKFLGDGMMIIFDSKESDDIIKATIEIQHFISKIQVSKKGKKISAGIGINSGEVILGTVGSKDRMEITIIGDVVNTASRIETITRTIEQNIIISEETYNNIINKKQFIINDIGYKTLKGKKRKIRLYCVEPIINIDK